MPSAINWLSGDPVGTSFLGGLFGGDDNEFKPYIDDNGNYVWTDPKKRNPVPQATVPGASKTPSGTYKKQAQQIQAITDLLPYLSEAVSRQILPNARAELEAKQLTSEPLAQLMTELYSKYGPQLNEVGNKIARENALAQVGTDTAALTQARQTLLPEALGAAKEYDPEFFATREATSGRLNDLLSSINLDSGLSPVEQREIEQSLAREAGTRGLSTGAPSQLETVGNAMRYGQAGFNRLQTNRSALSTAIANAAAALPTFKSGVDVFQVATGKSSQPNTGNAQFTGVNNVNNAANQALNLASGMGQGMNQQQLAQMQINANKKDWADYLNQVTSSISDIGSMAGGIAMCWIARKVYGVTNPKWLQFRDWLTYKAPTWFRDWYIANGERVASELTDAQTDDIRILMDNILAKQEVA